MGAHTSYLEAVLPVQWWQTGRALPYENKLPDLYEASITEIQNGLEKGYFTSLDLVKTYIARIDEVNIKGPGLRAVVELNPSALRSAEDLDKERKETGSRGPLHGIPILVKDNIATVRSEGMNTTAGSYALVDSVPPRDAHVVTLLRGNGAIILGKSSMSEWADWRGEIPSGFCGRFGQSTCPYSPLVDPAGSSSGSGIATAIGLATASLGTETDGSIMYPSSRNNIVGMKPTIGLISRAGVIPITLHQDSVGPMARSVADCAILLNVIVGQDERDEYTSKQPPGTSSIDYIRALKWDALNGARIGVPRAFLSEVKDSVKIATFNSAIESIRSLGADVVDPADFDNWEILPTKGVELETIVMTVDYKPDVENYLAELIEVPTGVRTMRDIIEFNIKNADKELILPYYADQSRLVEAEKSTMDEEYYRALHDVQKMAGQDGIDAVLKKFNLDALILPAEDFSSRPPAMVGYPIITVPMGFQPDDLPTPEAKPTRATGPGTPFGLTFFSTAWTEEKLLGYAYAYEQATKNRLKRRAYDEAIPKIQLEDVMVKTKAR